MKKSHGGMRKKHIVDAIQTGKPSQVTLVWVAAAARGTRHYAT